MSTYIASAKQVRHNFKESCSRWHRKGALPDEGDGTLAFQRLRQHLFTPIITPGFKLKREDKLFAIGSCFARGIELALIEQKMDVLSGAKEFDSFRTRNNETNLGFTNKYNTFSIYNELRWALDPAAKFPRDSIAKIDDELCCDPHTNPTLQPAGFEETLRRRGMIQMVTRRVAQCRVVIITLGLVEAWRDKSADTFINATP